MSLNEYTLDNTSIIDTWMNLDEKLCSLLCLKRDTAHIAHPSNPGAVKQLVRKLKAGGDPEKVLDASDVVTFENVVSVESPANQPKVTFVTKKGLGKKKTHFTFSNNESRLLFIDHLKNVLGSEFAFSYSQPSRADLAKKPILLALVLGGIAYGLQHLYVNGTEVAFLQVIQPVVDSLGASAGEQGILMGGAIPAGLALCTGIFRAMKPVNAMRFKRVVRKN